LDSEEYLQWLLGGYAYYPGASSSVDGAVIAYNLFNYNNPVTAHELGHGFNLRHTFEGDGGNTVCPANSSCTTQGDLCCDTPPTNKMIAAQQTLVQALAFG